MYVFLAGFIGGVIGSCLQLYFQNKNNRLLLKKKFIRTFHICAKHSEHHHGSLGLGYYECKICNKIWED